MSLCHLYLGAKSGLLILLYSITKSAQAPGPFIQTILFHCLVIVSIINQTEADYCSHAWSGLNESGWVLIYGELWRWGGVSRSARDPSVDKSWEQHLRAHAKALTQTQRERFHCHSIWCTRPSVHYMAKTVNNAQGVHILKEWQSYRSTWNKVSH